MSLASVNKSAFPPRLTHPDFEFAADEPAYDPDIHLSLTEPDFVVLLDGFRLVSKAPKLDRPVASNGNSQLAYTGPFRLLSDEGYSVLRKIIQRELVHQMGDERQPAYIIYNGYRSKWIQDFNRCPRVLEHLSRMTGDVRLLPTAFQSTYSHVNIGRANRTNIDAWHCDSVPYVVILLAYDMSQTVGGELQLIEREPKEAFRLIEEYKEERTRYDTFRNELTIDLEFAMHKTWRVNAPMVDLAVGGHPWPTHEQIVDRLTTAINELSQCRDLVLGIKTDRLGYYDEKKQKMGTYNIPPSQGEKNN